MKDDMNCLHARIFKQTTDLLIAIDKLPKCQEAARIFKMSYDQYKNLRTGRMPMSEFDWLNFRQVVKEADPVYGYKFLKEQLLPESL